MEQSNSNLDNLSTNQGLLASLPGGTANPQVFNSNNNNNATSTTNANQPSKKRKGNDGRELRDMGCPVNSNGNTIGLGQPLQQPITTVAPFTGTPPQPQYPPDFKKQVDEVDLPEATKSPTQVDINLKQTDDKLGADKMKALAKQHGLTLGGVPVNGYQPAKEDSTTLPDYMDYTGMRDVQTLSQLSEVGLATVGDKAVEVQFGYTETVDKKSGKPDYQVYASTNNAKTQGTLMTALEDPAKMIKEQATNGNGHDQSVAAKLVFFQQQQAERRREIDDALANKKIDPARHQELVADLERAQAIYNKVLDGDVNVVVNQKGEDEKGSASDNDRHAEQNIAWAMHEQAKQTGQSPDRVAIGGTKIRCEGCSSSLNPDMKQANGTEVMGKVYAKQASKAQHEKTFDDIHNGDSAFVPGKSQRAMSSSPPTLRKKINKPSNPDNNNTNGKQEE